jgi:hypothetical protein
MYVTIDINNNQILLRNIWECLEWCSNFINAVHTTLCLIIHKVDVQVSDLTLSFCWTA